jgi:hypothetical protein
LLNGIPVIYVKCDYHEGRQKDWLPRLRGSFDATIQKVLGLRDPRYASKNHLFQEGAGLRSHKHSRPSEEPFAPDGTAIILRSITRIPPGLQNHIRLFWKAIVLF